MEKLYVTEEKKKKEKKKDIYIYGYLWKQHQDH